MPEPLYCCPVADTLVPQPDNTSEEVDYSLTTLRNPKKPMLAATLTLTDNLHVLAGKIFYGDFTLVFYPSYIAFSTCTTHH